MPVPRGLRPLVVLWLVVGSAPPGLGGGCGQAYRTLKGETCAAVARKHGIALGLFDRLNPGVNCKGQIKPPRFVCVKPGSGKISVTDVPNLSSSATLKPRPISSLLTWRPFWAARQADFSAEMSSVPLNKCGADRHVVTQFSPRFLQAARTAGLAVLTDGRIFRYTQRNCWTEKDLKAFQPFVSVASCSFPVGAKLFVPELHNRKTTNDMVHNGCVRVDDTCEEGDEAVVAQLVGFGESLSAIWRTGGSRVHVKEAPACVIQAYS